jgi:hypothetical protein
LFFDDGAVGGVGVGDPVWEVGDFGSDLFDLHEHQDCLRYVSCERGGRGFYAHCYGSLIGVEFEGGDVFCDVIQSRADDIK